MFTTMTYDEFVDTYKPIENNITGNGNAFETYGDELEFVRSHDEKFIWTEIDGDGGCYIINGYHLVNRFQYYICEVPNALPKYQEVVVQVYKDCDTCGCSGGDGTTEDNEPCPECTDKYDDYNIYPDRKDLIEIYGEAYANEQV
jgi:hypothetical protein